VFAPILALPGHDLEPTVTRMGDVGWRQFVTVTLQNGNPETGDENEDVGVVIAYTPPADMNLGSRSRKSTG
jgi:hypothetical protein